MWERETCYRCGFSWDVTKKRSKDRVLCSDCRTRRAVTVRNGDSVCIPWHGRFAPDFITPIDENGDVFLPGLRICGNVDCIQPTHIV